MNIKEKIEALKFNSPIDSAGAGCYNIAIDHALKELDADPLVSSIMRYQQSKDSKDLTPLVVFLNELDDSLPSEDYPIVDIKPIKTLRFKGKLESNGDGKR